MSDPIMFALYILVLIVLAWQEYATLQCLKAISMALMEIQNGIRRLQFEKERRDFAANESAEKEGEE